MAATQSAMTGHCHRVDCGKYHECGRGWCIGGSAAGSGTSPGSGPTPLQSFCGPNGKNGVRHGRSWLTPSWLLSVRRLGGAGSRSRSGGVLPLPSRPGRARKGPVFGLSARTGGAEHPSGHTEELRPATCPGAGSTARRTGPTRRSVMYRPFPLMGSAPGPLPDGNAKSLRGPPPQEREFGYGRVRPDVDGEPKSAETKGTEVGATRFLHHSLMAAFGTCTGRRSEVAMQSSCFLPLPEARECRGYSGISSCRRGQRRAFSPDALSPCRPWAGAPS